MTGEDLIESREDYQSLPLKRSQVARRKREREREKVGVTK